MDQVFICDRASDAIQISKDKFSEITIRVLLERLRRVSQPQKACLQLALTPPSWGISAG